MTFKEIYNQIREEQGIEQSRYHKRIELVHSLRAMINEDYDILEQMENNLQNNPTGKYLISNYLDKLLKLKTLLFDYINFDGFLEMCEHNIEMSNK